MARPTVTVPPVTILMEMTGYGSLTEWLARPLPKAHVKALSPEARRRGNERKSDAQKRGSASSVRWRTAGPGEWTGWPEEYYG